MTEGQLLEVRINRYAVIRYDVPAGGTAVAVVSIQGDGADGRIEVIA